MYGCLKYNELIPTFLTKLFPYVFEVILWQKALAAPLALDKGGQLFLA